jgi:hypothetical protein
LVAAADTAEALLDPAAAAVAVVWVEAGLAAADVAVAVTVAADAADKRASMRKNK